MTPLIPTPTTNPKPINLPSDPGDPGSSRFQIQRMLPRHFKMVELHVAGLSNKAIAETLDCTPTSVSLILLSPIVKKEITTLLQTESNGSITQDLDAYASKAIKALKDNSHRAAQTQIDLLDCDDDSIRLRASGSILDRVLGKPDSKNASEGTQVKIEIKTQDAQLLILALNESKEISSNAENTKSTADGQDADSSQNGQGNVCQASITGSGLGHRTSEAQTSKVSIITSIDEIEKFDGSKGMPPTNQEP